MKKILEQAVKDYEDTIEHCVGRKDLNPRTYLEANCMWKGLCFYFHMNNVNLQPLLEIGMNVDKYMWLPPYMCSDYTSIIQSLILRRDWLKDKLNALK